MLPGPGAVGTVEGEWVLSGEGTGGGGRRAWGGGRRRLGGGKESKREWLWETTLGLLWWDWEDVWCVNCQKAAEQLWEKAKEAGYFRKAGKGGWRRECMELKKRRGGAGWV